MKTKNKKFDCVEMMHNGAKEMQKKISKLTNDEKLIYWKKRYDEINQKQMLLREKISEYNSNP